MEQRELSDWHVGTTYRYNLSNLSELAIKEQFVVMCVRRPFEDVFVFSEIDVLRPAHGQSVRQIWTTHCMDCSSAEIAWERWRYQHEVQEEIRWQMHPQHPDNRGAIDVPSSPTDSSRV